MDTSSPCRRHKRLMHMSPLCVLPRPRISSSIAGSNFSSTRGPSFFPTSCSELSPIHLVTMDSCLLNASLVLPFPLQSPPLADPCSVCSSSPVLDPTPLSKVTYKFFYRYVLCSTICSGGVLKCVPLLFEGRVRRRTNILLASGGFVNMQFCANTSFFYSTC